MSSFWIAGSEEAPISMFGDYNDVRKREKVKSLAQLYFHVNLWKFIDFLLLLMANFAIRSSRKWGCLS